jgi:hypothetical protein
MSGKIALKLECLGNFSGACCEEEDRFGSIEDILREEGKNK